MSGRGGGLLAGAVALQVGAIGFWALQAGLARSVAGDDPLLQWLWVPQLEFAERIERLTAHEGPALFALTVGPHLLACAGSALLATLAVGRSSGGVRVAARLVSALAVVLLVLGLPALGMAVLGSLMAANPKVW